MPRDTRTRTSSNLNHSKIRPFDHILLKRKLNFRRIWEFNNSLKPAEKKATQSVCLPRNATPPIKWHRSRFGFLKIIVTLPGLQRLRKEELVGWLTTLLGFSSLLLGLGAFSSRIPVAKTKKGGIGWVARDFAGILQFAGGIGGLFFQDTATGEAMAITEALLVCVHERGS
ncbi:hypothetical protein ACFX1Z_018669 [Malus domestica]